MAVMELNALIEEAVNNQLIKAVYSQSEDPAIRRVEITRKKEGYQLARYTEKQVFHKNINEIEIKAVLLEVFEQFRQLNLFYQAKEASVRKSKKGRLLISKKKGTAKLPEISHNRKKNYLIEEGQIIPPLIDMGIFTKEGKVVASMQDKYRQINKFIEIIDEGLKRLDQEQINIIDFGCGKSYLTFIVYYYLHEVKKRKVSIVGLDLKEEVIQHCNAAAQKYGYTHLKFEVGRIEGYQADFDVHMVLTLHACDTATDYALYHAIRWKTAMIFSVPCCQHELNGQIQSDAFSIVTRYGIAKERISALFTDIIRCNLLEACGYKVQLLEFVDLSHTPKNMLIRARKTAIPKEVKAKMLQEVMILVKEYHLDPTLLRLLRENQMLTENF